MTKGLIDWTSGKEVYKWEIEIDYIHNFKELYKSLHRWFEEEGFDDLNGGNTFETLYWQRDLDGGLQEHQIWWRAHKSPGQSNHTQGFYKYFFKLNFQTIAAKKAEVMHKGKKWKLMKANTILRFQSFLISDYGDWDTGFLKGMKQRFDKFWYKDKRKLHIDQLHQYSQRLQDEVKAFLSINKTQELPTKIDPPDFLP